jgi:uncharacterized protein YcfJ
MNKTMLTGVLAGIGIAVTGGVAAYSFMNTSPSSESGALVEQEATESAALAGAPATAAQAAPQATTAVQTAPRTTAVQAAPRATTAEATRTASPAPAVVEECWDEEVVVQADPRDDKAIAGTAAGAVIGGALADKLGDDNDLVTAAGAAAGAYLGRRAQREYQENRTTTVTERRCAPTSQ